MVELIFRSSFFSFREERSILSPRSLLRVGICRHYAQFMKCSLIGTISLSCCRFAAAQGDVNTPIEAVGECWHVSKPCDLRGNAIARCSYLIGPALISCACGAENMFDSEVYP